MRQKDKQRLRDLEKWAFEATIALSAATVIGRRSCNAHDHLHYANHDRLMGEAKDLGIATMTEIYTETVKEIAPG